MEVKEVLKLRREALGMSCEEEGKKIGVSASTISRWETGDIANMKRDKIVKLAEVLQISPAVIMGWEKYEEREAYYADKLRPELAELLEVAKKCSKEDVKLAIDMLQRMQK